ncbi:MAG: glycine cleavage system aminomethyltransferase GcvT [Bacteroidales bacterium]|nr:glycine cleavage system aminomethyltransferase GcvT [Bacteroidales bacterium]MDD3858781.1 glycine cleavage system aminomethyltransferase GcvT [Bacteroidales bacterium]
MKTTAFTHHHIELGAKMAEFAGYNMPIEFTGINDEHIACREKIGLFDVSHMGEFWVKGPKAFSFIQKVTSNNVADLFDGKVQYSCFPNEDGGIVDDLLVYRFDENNYLLVVNAANIEKDWNWCVKYAKEMGLEIGVEFQNSSDDICQLAVQGPYALKAMQKLTSENVIDMEYYCCKQISFAGIDKVIFSTTGYTGAGGCEIYAYNKDAEKLYQAVLEAGKEFGIQNVGLGARDTLRLEMGFCLYGHDINDTTSPIEAGLGWITKFVDGNDFTNRAYHEKLKAEGVSKSLKGFEMIDRGIPRQHYPVYDANGNQIGEVTSGTMSPMMKIGIGMAYVAKGFGKEGAEIYIGIRDKKLKAKIVKTPIFKGQKPTVK